jgi:hypothetical protein
MDLDELEAKRLAAPQELVQLGRGLDVALQDRLGWCRRRRRVAKRRRKRGAQAPADPNLVPVTHVRGGAKSAPPSTEG